MKMTRPVPHESLLDPLSSLQSWASQAMTDNIIQSPRGNVEVKEQELLGLQHWTSQAPHQACGLRGCLGSW